MVTWFLVVFGDEVTKILCNSLFNFFTEQGKTVKTEIKVKKITQPKFVMSGAVIHRVLSKFQAGVLAFVAVGMKRTMKLLIQYPAIYFTPMFTPFIFGPVFSQPCGYKSCFTAVCFRSCCSCAKKKKTMHLSFSHTYFNILLTGIGFCLALLYFDNNLFPLRGTENKNMELTLWN